MSELFQKRPDGELTFQEKRKALQPRKMSIQAPGVHQEKTYQDCFTILGYNAAMMGMNKEEIAILFGIHRQTLYEWIDKYPDFGEAMEEGRLASTYVMGALNKAALGYDKDEVERVIKDGKVISEKVTTKHFKPDIGAVKYLLNNRHPDKFKDKVEITGKDGGAIEVVSTSINVNDAASAAAIYQKMIRGE